MTQDARARLYQQLDPHLPVAANDDARYVDWQQSLRHDDVKTQLVQAVIMGGATNQVRFLTGHRGNGKTSELLRVKAQLEAGVGGRRVFVSFLVGEQWLDLQSVDARDVVFQVTRQLAADLSARGMSFAKERFDGWRDELIKAVQAIQPESITVGAAPLEVEMAFKDSTSLRAELRKLLDPRLPTLYDLINDVIDKAREWLARPENGGFEDILVIVDELDRIPRYGPEDTEQRVNLHERLFLTNASNLRGFKCDMVYAIPLALAYSHAVGNLLGTYGSVLYYLPGVPVSDRTGKARPDGVGVMRDMLDRRVQLAGLTMAEVFHDTAEVERLIAASGGYIRTMLTLLRSALERSEDGLPVAASALERTIKSHAQMLSFGLSDADWAVLRQVHDTKEKVAGEADAERFYSLMHSLYVHVYEDDDGYWYDWTPLIADLPEARA